MDVIGCPSRYMLHEFRSPAHGLVGEMSAQAYFPPGLRAIDLNTMSGGIETEAMELTQFGRQLWSSFPSCMTKERAEQLELLLLCGGGNNIEACAITPS